MNEPLRALRSQVEGEVVVPGDAAYDPGRRTFMNAFEHSPRAIVYCASPADVAAALRCAREAQLRPVLRSSGHSTAGWSVNDGLVVDVRRLDAIELDVAKGTVVTGPGTQLARLDAALEPHGLHMPTGSCPDVAVAGFTSGGGYSFSSLMFGMCCDSLLRATVALADGRVVTASEHEHADLFWALRGGTGNNFGALLELEYRLSPLGTLWGFGFRWPLGNAQQVAVAAEVMQTWQHAFTGDAAPENLGQQACFVMTRNRPGENLAPYLWVRGVCRGTEAECRAALAPLLAHEALRDVWRAGTYADFNQSLLSVPTTVPAHVPESARVVSKSHLVARRLSRAECTGIIELFRAAPNACTFIAMEAYGGAINRVAPEATAFWHRRASLDVFVYSFWLGGQSRNVAERYVRSFDRVMDPLTNGHSYQNYPHRGIADFGHRYFGGNLERLLQVKRAYDPSGLFTYPQGLSAI